MKTKKVLFKTAFAAILLITSGFSSCDMSDDCLTCYDGSSSYIACGAWDKYQEELAVNDCY